MIVEIDKSGKYHLTPTSKVELEFKAWLDDLLKQIDVLTIKKERLV